MPLKVNFPDSLLKGVRRNLVRNRQIAWIAFIITLIVGFVLAEIWDDVTQFARAGSIGVIIGIAFARWRFLVLKREERKLERALRNPQQWLEEATRRQFPSLTVKADSNSETLSSDEVRTTVEGLIADLDKMMFGDEAAIVIISTLIWGYGDLLAQKITCLLHG